ncbi:hypothetical protein [Vreelandella neptunia]|uniref:Uncharacterized protein n=1 Tax=Vreelandella neptunia TaxID=115551 RepID=A0ABS9S6U4_9GAMM|nr:hypothetical protein [Halomonas neptunia]MCH4811843.1 hypothetical protein [Halomonas neptunia]
MPNTRNIVKDFRVETAVGARKCHASSLHTIKAGEKHFAYNDPGRINICIKCAPVILKVAESHVAKVRQELQ